MKIVEILLAKDDGTISLFKNYVFFAGIATVADFTTLYIFTEIFEFHYLISGLFGYIVGMSINFSLNKYYNFKNESERIRLQFSIFMGVALVGLLLNQIILYILVDITEMWYIHAKFFSVSLVMLWSFWGHKKVTFNYLK